MKDIKYFFSITFIVIGILGFLFLSYMHEQVHVAIFNSYSIESKVEYFKYFPDFVTIPNKSCSENECILANNLNEIITYPLMSFYMLLFLGFLALIILIEKYIYEKNKIKHPIHMFV